MNLDDVRTRSAEIGWERQRDAHDGTQAEVEETIYTTKRDEWVVCCEVWNGLFGGYPSRDDASPTDSAPEATSRKTHGQVQEITSTIYAQPPSGARRRLFERDLHQLDPSASFPGTERHEYVWPIRLPKGTRIYVVTRTSQKDRGAHTRATVTLCSVDPYNDLVKR